MHHDCTPDAWGVQPPYKWRISPTRKCFMRSLDDIAVRTKNGFWYYQVRQIEHLSDAALDRKVFGKDCGRRRYFEGIRRSWSSPKARSVVGGMTVLKVVDGWDRGNNGSGPYAEATKNFKSTFWKFVSDPTVPLDEYIEHVEKYVRSNDLVRLRRQDLRLYESFLSAYEPALQCGDTPAYRAMLHNLAMIGTLDALSVLIAIFREAMARGSLDQAIAIREAIRLGMFEMLVTGRMPPEVATCVMALVESRVLANHWVSVDEWKSSDQKAIKNRSSAERKRAFDRYRLWFIAHATTRNGYGDTPFVIRTDGILWLERNRDALVAARKFMDMAIADQIHDNIYGTGGEQVSKHLAEAARILQELSPRPTDLQACYYDPPPPLSAELDQEHDPRDTREGRLAALLAFSRPHFLRDLQSSEYADMLDRILNAAPPPREPSGPVG